MTTEERLGELKERIKREAKRKQQTVAQACESCGISTSSLYYWYGHDPSFLGIARLAAHFGCSIDYLWSRTNNRTGYYTPDAVEDALSEVERAVADARRRALGQQR